MTDLEQRTTDIALILPADLTWDGWADLADQIARNHHSSMWYLGDWLVYAQQHFERDGDHDEADVAQLVDARTAIPQSTVKLARLVAARFEPGQRRLGLSWSHHLEVYRVDDDTDAERLLDEAERDGLSTKDLRARVSRLTGSIDPANPKPKPPPRCAVSHCSEPELDGAPAPVCEQHGQELVEWWQARSS